MSSYQDPQPLKEQLSNLLVTPDKERKAASKLLRKNEDSIVRELDAGETPLVVAADWRSISGGIVLITDRRSITFHKGKVDRQLRHHEVHDTRLGTMPNGSTLVEVRSHKSELDYRPNDPERYEHIVQVAVGTPRAGQMICAAVDARLA